VNVVDHLARQTQRHPARHQQPQPGRRRHPPRQERRCLDDLLEVVEHQQQLPLDQKRPERLGQRLSRLLTQPQRLRNRAHDTVRLPNRGQEYDEHAVRELIYL
jgi:hypothetical protein